MDVILLERVEKLGGIGDVVKVKNGFARNYLLPRKKALRANDANRKLFEAQRAQIEADNASRRSDAEAASKGVDGKTVKLICQASNVGHLYGSVSARDIAEALEGVGAKVAKSQVVLDRPIKAISVHDVKIALHPEVAVTVKVNVARSPEEADLQAQGIDVLQQMFEEEAAPIVAEDLAPPAEEAVEEGPAADAEATGEAPVEKSAEAAPEAAETPAEEAPEAAADASADEGELPEA